MSEERLDAYLAEQDRLTEQHEEGERIKAEHAPLISVPANEAATMLRDMICNECHAPLMALRDMSNTANDIVRCALDNSHSGFVERSKVDRQEARSRRERKEVERAYSHIIGKEPEEKKSAKDNISDLGYQEERCQSKV